MPAPLSTDLIDRVDEKDRVVGAIARGEVFAQHAGFRVVHVLVFDSLGRVLLQRIGHDRRRSPGRWGSSVAGYVARGEAPASAARRRMAEEVALSGALTFVGKVEMEDEGATKFVYVYRTVGEEPHIVDRHHVEELRYWDVSSLVGRLADSPDEFSETLPFVLTVAGLLSS